MKLLSYGSLKYSTQKKVLGYAMVLPVFLLVFVVMCGVALYSLVLSFQNVDLIGNQETRFVGFQTYIEVFRNPETLTVIKNSLIWVFTSTFSVILLGTTVGTLLSDNQGFFRFSRSFMLIPWVLPGVVVAGLWKWMFHSHTGLINKVLIDIGILDAGFAWLGTPGTVLYSVVTVIVWRLFPLFALIVASAIQSIDLSLYEAGRVDGMSSWQGFLYITLPSIKYQILTMGLINMIWIMNNLVLINVMTKGGPLYFSETFPVYMYKLGFTYAKLSQAAAVTMINFMILVILSGVYIYIFRKNQARD